MLDLCLAEHGQTPNDLIKIGQTGGCSLII
jgi:hypothetical protein